MLALPDILFEEQYKDTWEWEDDGWKPKAKANAPDAVKAAIDTFISEAEQEDDGDDFILQ